MSGFAGLTESERALLRALLEAQSKVEALRRAVRLAEGDFERLNAAVARAQLREWAQAGEVA